MCVSIIHTHICECVMNCYCENREHRRNGEERVILLLLTPEHIVIEGKRLVWSRTASRFVISSARNACSRDT